MTDHDPAYEAAVQALFARRAEPRVPSLARIRALCAALGNPERAFPAVHVTGTNGKTSITRMVAALLEAHGLASGAYTSPHLQDVRERVRLGGRPLPRADLAAGLDRLAPVLAGVERERGEQVSFFEAMTVLALSHFAAAALDVGVVEVGMGGRWDATNVVDGRVAVIGRVGLDHAELGSRVAQVAREKAGIVKPGAVVVSAAQEPSAARVLADEVARAPARLVLAGRDVAVLARSANAGGQLLALRAADGGRHEVRLPLYGRHQAANALLALAAAEAHLGELDPRAVRAGFAAVRSPGRLELLARHGRAPVLLDGAHNPAGARTLTAALRTEPAFLGFRRRIVVLGVLDDKDVEGVVAALLPVTDHLVATQPPYGHAVPSERLMKLARAEGRPADAVPDAAEALERASTLAGPGDVVLVTGSLYLVGAARGLLSAHHA